MKGSSIRSNSSSSLNRLFGVLSLRQVLLISRKSSKALIKVFRWPKDAILNLILRSSSVISGNLLRESKQSSKASRYISNPNTFRKRRRSCCFHEMTLFLNFLEVRKESKIKIKETRFFKKGKCFRASAIEFGEEELYVFELGF